MIPTKVNKSLFLLYDVHMTKNLTISGIAMNIFFDKFYQHDYDLDGNDGIPFIQNTNIFMDIKKAYYGGRVEFITLRYKILKHLVLIWLISFVFNLYLSRRAG